MVKLLTDADRKANVDPKLMPTGTTMPGYSINSTLLHKGTLKMNALERDRRDILP